MSSFSTQIMASGRNVNGMEFFPSLGFDGETRQYGYYHVDFDHIKISVWKLTGGRYEVRPYRRVVYNGVTSWQGHEENKWMVDDLLAVKALIYHITSEGNGDGQPEIC
jgi:hypothetical protein